MALTSRLLGDDRIENWDSIGRNIRCGSPAALKTSDQEIVRELIRKGEFSEAKKYVELLQKLWFDMNVILFEWGYGFAEQLRKFTDASSEARVSADVYKLWSSAASKYPQDSPEALEQLKTLLSEDGRAKSRVELKEHNILLGEKPQALFQELLTALDSGQKEEALKSFTQLVAQNRSRHDLCCQYLWVYPSLIIKHFDQELSEKVMRESFKLASGYENFFKVMAKLSPEGAVAIIAEHLRAHYSGPERQGEVEIVEDQDSFTIIYDACGSGGAMRRLAADAGTPEGFENYPEASLGTWGLKNKVPAYCAHCAHNESEMIDRFGYPAWVVNFNPDPDKPCSWTVFKDFSKVPEEFYERVGRKKDSSRIKSLPQDKESTCATKATE